MNRSIVGFCLGSPPHTRGKDFALLSVAKARRITPAHAGKSIRSALIFAYFADHPRTRGEKRKSTTTRNRSEGSPPHTRGKVEEQIKVINHRRITPAHAGKSEYDDAQEEDLKDHPRTRGEKKPRSEQLKSDIGSPPHPQVNARAKQLRLPT